MAPPRSRPPPDDSRSEASSTREKPGAAPPANGKGRRIGGNAAGGSSLRDVITAGTSSAVATTSNGAMVDPNPLQWNSFEPETLEAYRYDYRLNTPAAFNKTYNQIVLSRSPIGRMSPTMAGKKEHRRQSKDQLATAVRKHFKSMGVVENDVIIDFLYKVRYQDKNFRMKFAGQKPR